ncbi:hypothetical protein NPIL_543271 [Nephila pilipes]|uniref:Uncharacterized protein n=1 Tax=Nephila pilipes TaxID=299642 RepID=A0A8X6UAL2_NEPPI|nr:hypothetical protein NPIL_543271 [Nephila pilipes]
MIRPPLLRRSSVLYSSYFHLVHKGKKECQVPSSFECSINLRLNVTSFEEHRLVDYKRYLDGDILARICMIFPTGSGTIKQRVTCISLFYTYREFQENWISFRL